MTIDEVNQALRDFLERHKKSSIAVSPDDNSILIVKNPWGDEALVFTIPKDDPQTLFDVLNAVLLPHQFSGLWHTDSKDFEILYTALPLGGEQSAMKDRKFVFTFRGKDYTCEFMRSSDRFLCLAEHVQPISPSAKHRNIPSYQYYVHAEKGIGGAVKIPDMSPISFWIRNFDWEDETAVALCRHLNFYISYYDTASPTIDIHAPTQEGGEPRERYIAGSFPKTIVATELNSNLMHFWAGTRGGDVFRRFLYSYQILEFASFYYVEDNIKRAVKMALSTPHIKDEMDQVIIEVIDSVRESKIWEGTKMNSLLKEVVDPKLIWREVEKNKDYFCKTIEFDGGFILKPLVVEKTTIETFVHDWHDKFNGTIRGIRNALSHGKEQSMSSVIAPTASNFANIQPWTALISVAAGEVVVYYTAAM
jgi:hypothetical protein